MYLPAHFREERTPVLHELIRTHPLATLVSMGPDGLIASHIPMLLDPHPEPYGTLRCHLARGNPQWRSFSPEVPALAIFNGPEHYISPLWYETTTETGKVVPTWNYAVVHAYGPLQVVEDSAWLRRLVTELTAVHEAGFPEPWKVEDAPADYISAQLKAIVGVEIPITRLEGKWKVSQNRPEKDRLGVISALSGAAGPGAAAMVELVSSALRGKTPEKQ